MHSVIICSLFLLLFLFRNCCGFPECRFWLKNSKGTIISPSLPLNRQGNLDCEWIVKVSPNNVVELNLLTLDLDDKELFKDYFRIYDGMCDSSFVLETYYSSHMSRRTLRSTSNVVCLYLHLDENSTRGSFEVGYQEMLPGECSGDQLACGYGEKLCYGAKQRCDGVWNCPERGGDERGCGGCHTTLFFCGTANQCYSEENMCDGRTDCNTKKDEKKCTSNQCGSHNGTFLCHNALCIFHSWHCDGTDDCGDASDELNCASADPSMRVITASVIGSLICLLLLILTTVLICRLNLLRRRARQPPCPEDSDALSQYEQMLVRQFAPPPYDEAMLTSRPYDEVMREIAMERALREANNSRDDPLLDIGPLPSYNTAHFNDVDNSHLTVGIPSVIVQHRAGSKSIADSSKPINAADSEYRPVDNVSSIVEQLTEDVTIPEHDRSEIDPGKPDEQAIPVHRSLEAASSSSDDCDKPGYMQPSVTADRKLSSSSDDSLLNCDTDTLVRH